MFMMFIIYLQLVMEESSRCVAARLVTVDHELAMGNINIQLQLTRQSRLKNLIMT
jgi:hypothetical protein